MILNLKISKIYAIINKLKSNVFIKPIIKSLKWLYLKK